MLQQVNINLIKLVTKDSESSCIRSINMKSLKATRGIVGGDTNPKNLHAYGDIDGQSTTARLQHPLGVHFIGDKNVVLVADTYNHKIKVIDPFRNEVFTWLGNGKAALKDESTFNSSFNEPSGFSSIFDKKINDVRINWGSYENVSFIFFSGFVVNLSLYIADCNNHCIRSVIYDQGEAKTCQFKGIPLAENAPDNDETEGTTNKSGVNDEDLMGLECDGNQCYPKFF